MTGGAGRSAQDGIAQAMGEQTTALLRSLIRQACVNDGTPESGQEMRGVAVLEEFLAGSPVVYEVIEPAPGRGSLVARVLGTDPSAPSMALVGHLDVVPVPDAPLWQHDPFGAEVVDGVVWGRGAIDMLGLTAAFAVVARSVAERESPLAGDLVLAAVADEETGGRFGTGWIAQHRPELIRADYALTENGGVVFDTSDRPGITVTVGEKGGALRTLNVRGRPGHGSVPWRSKNAAAIAAEAVHRIATGPGEPLLLEHWRAFVAASGLGDDLRARLLDAATVGGAIDELGPLAAYAHALSHMTVAPTVVRAGAKRNMIPGEATVGLDIRLLPGQGSAEVDRYLAATLGELLADIDIVEEFTSTASVSAVDTALYRVIERSVRRHYPGARLVPLIMPGGTDGRHLRQLGAVTYGFGLLSRAWDAATFRAAFHGRDERIDVESLHLTTAALHDTVLGVLSGG